MFQIFNRKFLKELSFYYKLLLWGVSVKDIVVSKDIFVVLNKSILNDNDREVLIMLYEPIIGVMPTNLFFILWSYLDRMHVASLEYIHEDLIKKLGISFTSFVENREKLEAIGLLKSYVKNDIVNNYVYELYAPVTPYEFFNNPILSTLLYSSVGKKEYNRLLKYFEIPSFNLDDYQNISVKFKDIFEITPINQNVEYDMIRKRSINNVEIEPNINLNLVLNMIPDEVLNKRSITKDMKDFIYKLSFIYNLNDEVIREILTNSINIKKSIDKDKLKENCLKYYSFENYGGTPSIIYRTQPESLRTNLKTTSNKTKIIYTFETTSPHDFLLSKTNSKSLSKTDVKLLEHLLLDLDLKAGVVNVLIDFVLKINNNKLTSKFVEAIALQWKRSNIETVEDAIEMAKKEYRARTKKVKSNKIEPDWLNKDIENKVASEEEEQKIKDLLSEFE